jgi:AcrR family transcriptional regulator
MDSRQRARPSARHGRPSRADQVAGRRRSLLDAAGVVFRRDGYLAATVDTIADAAGLTKGAVYSQFASKADLFLTLLEERVGQRSTANAAATADVFDVASAAAFLDIARIPAANDLEWQLALLEFRVVAARDPELNARYGRIHDVAIEGISRTFAAMYERAGIEPQLPLLALARLILGMEAGGFLEELVAGHPVPPEIGRLTRTLIFGIAEPETTTGGRT